MTCLCNWSYYVSVPCPPYIPPISSPPRQSLARTNSGELRTYDCIPEKRDQQYFVRYFEKFKCIIVIFCMQRCDSKKKTISATFVCLTYSVPLLYLAKSNVYCIIAPQYQSEPSVRRQL